jgi:DnaJ-class molecular chaperone
VQQPADKAQTPQTAAVCPTCKGAKTVSVGTAGEKRPCPSCGGRGTAGYRTK